MITFLILKNDIIVNNDEDDTNNAILDTQPIATARCDNKLT